MLPMPWTQIATILNEMNNDLGGSFANLGILFRAQFVDGIMNYSHV